MRVTRDSYESQRNAKLENNFNIHHAEYKDLANYINKEYVAKEDRGSLSSKKKTARKKRKLIFIGIAGIVLLAILVFILVIIF